MLKPRLNQWSLPLRSFLSVILGCLLFGSATTFASKSSSRISTQYTLCVRCHGQNGEGKIELKAPAIAGLPAWYVSAQLKKFRMGARGKHPQDLAGIRMRPMAKTLKESDIEGVAAHVAALPPVKITPTLKGNTAKGEVLYAPCIACHGAKAQGNKTLNAPPLGMMNDWYLKQQLYNFKNGIRGFDPALDPTGASMVAMAGLLVDEQAIDDVLSYIFANR